MNTKYYVSCGPFKRMVLASHAEAAAVEVFKNGKHIPTVLDQDVRVSERGHESHEDDEIFDVSFVMAMAGFVFEKDD